MVILTGTEEHKRADLSSPYQTLEHTVWNGKWNHWNNLNQCSLAFIWASLIAQLVKTPPAMQETLVQFLGREDPLQKGQGTHSSILAWRIPMDRGAQWATVHGFTKSWTRLSNKHTNSHYIQDFMPILSENFLSPEIFSFFQFSWSGDRGE